MLPVIKVFTLLANFQIPTRSCYKGCEKTNIQAKLRHQGEKITLKIFNWLTKIKRNSWPTNLNQSIYYGQSWLVVQGFLWRFVNSSLTAIMAWFLIWGSPPTGLHFGPKRDYITGSLFKQARYKIVICVLYYYVIE